MNELRVVDSHTAGEPTRVVIAGQPDIGTAPAATQRDRLRRDHDALRRAVILEPRGHDAIVGAYLLPSISASAVGQLIFFNNEGYLGMCGHGTIGVVATLAWLGRIGPGHHRFETPVGEVEATLHADGEVSIDNVESFRHRARVEVDTRSHGRLTGDIAWGGNWFFLVDDHGLDLRLSNLAALLHCCRDLMDSLAQAGITGDDGGRIDHIELFGPPVAPEAQGRNFVLCPGGAYDRSPCGTGTSAKLACLAADGKLPPDTIWCQESVIGSQFQAHYRLGTRGVLPTIRGRAFVTAESRFIFEPGDPFAAGIGP
ncbi:MAG: proline racemase family protein [Planctomycetes bacterium]|nr:proline racemase family protein [Planctomycetota bacterium]